MKMSHQRVARNRGAIDHSRETSEERVRFGPVAATDWQPAKDQVCEEVTEDDIDDDFDDDDSDCEHLDHDDFDDDGIESILEQEDPESSILWFARTCGERQAEGVIQAMAEDSVGHLAHYDVRLNLDASERDLTLSHCVIAFDRSEVNASSTKRNMRRYFPGATEIPRTGSLCFTCARGADAPVRDLYQAASAVARFAKTIGNRLRQMGSPPAEVVFHFD